MILKVLFIQREQRYEGELAPEAVAIQDEFGDDENPGYLKMEYEKYKAFPDVTNAVIVDIDVAMQEIQKLLNPTSPIIKGKVI